MSDPFTTSSATTVPAGTRAAQVQRRAARPVPLTATIILVLSAVAVFVALSVMIAPSAIESADHEALPYNFKSERGTITLLSSAMMLLAACLAAATLRTAWTQGGRTRMLWLLLTGVMTYFSVDEVFGFHERMGDFLDGHVPTGPFRTFNDLIVIGYGMAAIPAALLLWREVLRYHRLLAMLVVTGVLFVATSGVDTLSETPTPISVVVEESIKVTCSTFFMLSMLTGFVAARCLQHSGGRGAAPRPVVRPPDPQTQPLLMSVTDPPPLPRTPLETPPGGATTDSRKPARLTASVWFSCLVVLSFIGLLVPFVTTADARVFMSWLMVLPVGGLMIQSVRRYDGC